MRSAFAMLAPVILALAAGAERVRLGPASVSLATSTPVAPSPAPAPEALPPGGAVRVASHDTTEVRAGMTVVNRYMSYDSSAKSVAITLIAAANSAQGGFNFNGGSRGDQTITVPLGWTVDIDFQNHDVVPHSALVITAEMPVPSIPEKPAFPRAYTSHLIDGLQAQTGNDTMRFTASRAGDYLIACGVPGHALSGMFIRFVVSAAATAPGNTGTIAKPK